MTIIGILIKWISLMHPHESVWPRIPYLTYKRLTSICNLNHPSGILTSLIRQRTSWPHTKPLASVHNPWKGNPNIINQTEDVVAAHREHNHAPRLPSNSQLLTAHHQQASSGHWSNPSKENTAAPQLVKQSVPVSPATEGSDQWQIQYYDPPINHRAVVSKLSGFGGCTIYFKLWEDLGNWCSALRKKAQTWVAQHYQWDPEHCCEQNIEIAKQLLGGSGLFPTKRDMSTILPILLSPLKVVLDEMVSGQAKVNFKVTIYAAVYTEILRLMSKCDSSAIHGSTSRDILGKLL
ncbi:hypothetical protein OG21DRAFT_1526998 [Imleria badia]|nr:hypothetical protein OG21DRAFT_1526998 [Imleria badia]